MKKTQYIVASLHLVFFIFVVLKIIYTPFDALWQLLWTVLFFPDFPATVLLFLIFIVVPNAAIYAVDDIFSGMFSKHPYDSFSNFWLPFFVYGVVGTVWWFYVPRVISWLKKHLWRGKQNNGKS